jgi:hypothetical protein
MRIVLFFLFSISYLICFSQNNLLGIQWQRCYGGSDTEFGSKVLNSSDGGFLMLNRFTTTSNNGDVTTTRPYPNGDIWVVKTNANGQIEWQKCLGGTNADEGWGITETLDGGYAIAGVTYSTNGDVTNAPNGEGDFWIIKLNSLGEIQWDKTYGGSKDDNARSITCSQDGGFVVTGFTYSDLNDGDVSGFKGVCDTWVIKINSTGDLEWQKCLGGTNADGSWDVVTCDDGYVITGFTYSNDSDVTGNHGAEDIWLVKLDLLGNLVWQKCIGGTGSEMAFSITKNIDGDFLLAGNTNSSNGNMTGYYGGGSDAWVAKVDPLGNIIWSKSLGGSGADDFLAVIPTADGNSLFYGYSNSTNGDAIGNVAGSSWLVKVDPLGTLIWQKGFGGSGAEIGLDLIETSDGGIALFGYTSSNDGDFSGNHGGYDSWALKVFECQVSASNISASSCDSYTLNGQTYTASGTYTQVVQNAIGCDSTITLNLTINQSSSAQLNEVICGGSLYILNGTSYGVNFQAPGDQFTINQVLQNSVGCDSLLTVTVTYNPIVINSEISICQGESALIHGFYRSTAGLYSQRFSAANGCDSISNVTLVVKSLPPVDAGQNFLVCSGSSVVLSGTGADSYSWSNFVQNSIPFTLGAAGSYNYSVTGTSLNGCTATDYITVTVVQPIVNAGNSQSVCSGNNIVLSASGALSYTWDNGVTNQVPFTLSSPGNYTYTVTGTSPEGCTSTSNVTIFVNPNPIVNAGPDHGYCVGTLTTLTATGASTYTWDNGVTNGVPFNPNGQTTFTVTGTSMSELGGCSATDQVTIYYLNPSSSQLTETACGHYSLNGQTYAASGTYTQVIPNAVGCDSTITLDLTIKDSTTSSITEVACNSFTAPDGQVFTQTGLYTSVIPNSVQCDSIITVNLTIVPTDAPEICMVSVDSAGINNVIYWDKTVYPSADTFYVYREIQNNNYQIIGTLPFSANSQFVDTVRALYFPNTGDPKISSSRYKLAFRDTCGNLSSLGRYHRTMFLQDQMNGNFNWNHYEIENETSPVAALTTYYFLRDNNLDGIFESVIGSTTSNLATDPSYSTFQNTADWRIETSWSIQCEGTKKLTEKSLLTTSKSNRRNYQANGLEENIANELGIRCYPNVVTQTLYVLCSNPSLEGDLALLDLFGKVVLEQNLSGDTQVDVSNLAKGTYFLKIESNGRVYSQKLIKN